MKKRVLFISCVFVFAFTIGATQKTCDPPEVPVNAQKELQLGQAIKGLEDPSKIVRRKSAEQISLLIDAPGIQRAIKPLAEVLLGDIPSGIFTEQICAENLGQIAAFLNGPEANRALDALVESLESDEFDAVRASSADALGISKSERAVQPLEDALANDGSPLVRYASRQALYRLASAGIAIPSLSKSNSKTANANSPPPGDEEKMLYEYFIRQVLYANPPLDQRGGGK